MPDVFPDPKWLELLKASRPQAAALCVACVVVLFAPRMGLVDTLSDWVLLPALFAGVLSGGLSLFSLWRSTYKVFPAHVWLVRYLNIRRKKKEIREYIPFMTDKDREIIAYLLYFNLKMFEADSDGGNASLLISKGVITLKTHPQLRYRGTNIPMTIPDYVWDILMMH